MPVISRFRGIVVSMFYADHAPPHFHAYYGSYSVVVEIESAAVHGRFPPRALRELQEWRTLRMAELRANWRRARRKEPLLPIDPLM